MKDTRKLSVIYFVISLIMLLLVAFGCDRAINVDYIHTVNGYEVYYAETDNPEYIEMLQKNLHNAVKDKYNIENVTKTRAEWYKSIVKK